MSQLQALLHGQTRHVAGLMSGTSVDGVDVVVARIAGSGPGMTCSVMGSAHVPYGPDLRAIVLDHALDHSTTVRSISQLNVALSHVYREAVALAAADAGIPLSGLDLIGCHGQTVQHVPDPEDVAGRLITSTLQLGDPTVLANLLGIPVVGNFRMTDMTLGGQGAPLVPYFDFVTFSDSNEYRVLLNLGGIANLTFLRPGGGPDEVIAFDTGPANMLIDYLCELFFGEPMDRDGVYGGSAAPNKELMAQVLRHEYFDRPPPKTTGRELFDSAFAESICVLFEGLHGPRGRWNEEIHREIIASVTWLTARTVAQAMDRWNPLSARPDTVIAAGGGTMNPSLMAMLQDEFDSIPVRPISDFGIQSDHKEALCFAVLAHEYVNEVPTGMPSVTGASAPGLLGCLCLPSVPLSNHQNELK